MADLWVNDACELFHPFYNPPAPKHILPPSVDMWSWIETALEFVMYDESYFSEQEIVSWLNFELKYIPVVVSFSFSSESTDFSSDDDLPCGQVPRFLPDYFRLPRTLPCFLLYLIVNL